MRFGKVELDAQYLCSWKKYAIDGSCWFIWSSSWVGYSL